MNTFIALLRREFWEHRRIMIWPPAVIGIIAVGLTLSALIVIANEPGFSGVDGLRAEQASLMTDENRKMFTMASVFLVSNVFMGICGLTALYYLTGSLYNDRKDRSILFWKSLPSTEMQTVFSKLLTGMLAFPLAALIFTVATVLTCYLVLTISTLFLDNAIVDTLVLEFGLSFGGLLSGIGVVASNALHVVIFFIPLFCYLMLISSLSRRSPILIALLPYIALLIISPILLRYLSADNWLIVFISNYFGLIPDVFEGLSVSTNAQGITFLKNDNFLETLGILFSAFEFWIMMAISAGLMWATITLRKNSSDLG